MNWKGTKGKWEFLPNQYNLGKGRETGSIGSIKSNHSIDDFYICSVWGDIPQEQADANAKLIADAGNTIQKCDMYPSELLAAYKETIDVLKRISRIEGDRIVTGKHQ